MNIIAIMGPHGVFYKDEPIKELESALLAQGFQIIWPQNSVDLLKFIEHNPRICGVIFDWDDDAPRDKCALSCAINGIHAAFHYLKKNYISGSVMTVPTG